MGQSEAAEKGNLMLRKKSVGFGLLSVKGPSPLLSQVVSTQTEGKMRANLFDMENTETEIIRVQSKTQNWGKQLIPPTLAESPITHFRFIPLAQNSLALSRRQ